MSKRDHEFEVLLPSKACRSDSFSGTCESDAGRRNVAQTIAHMCASWANGISIDVVSSIAVGTPVYHLSSDASEPSSQIAEEPADDAGGTAKKQARHGLVVWLEDALTLIGTLGEADRFARRR